MNTNDLTSRVRRGWPRALGALAILGAFALGYLGRGGGPAEPPSPSSPAGTVSTTVWTCSMHPQIRMPESGLCPICAMDLIPVDTGAPGEGDDVPALTLSPRARALAEIRTAPALRRSVEKTVRLVGRIEATEGRVRTISARTGGRIEALHVDLTGEHVREGDPLFDLYSPDLYAAQEELIQSIAAAAAITGSGPPSSSRTALSTVEAARERLRLWGIGDREIGEIESRGRAMKTLTVRSPITGIVVAKHAVEGMYVTTGTNVYQLADLSTVWLTLEAYESDLPWLQEGLPASFETDALPGETFSGTVSFIYPVLDPRTRTVRLRVDVPNPLGRLRPGLFARARVHARMAAIDGVEPLTIPATAPLLTGTRAIVYVADPETDGRYVGREVTLGPRADAHYVVTAGLVEGERVVVNGAFKIDSALQILSHPSMMNPEGVTGGHGQGGHDHGVAPAGGRADPRAPEGSVPESLRENVDDLLSAYFALADALSHDDADGARAAAAVLGARLEDAPRGRLPERQEAAWDEARSTLRTGAHDIVSATEMEAQRAAFEHVSNAAIALVRRFGTTGRHAVHVYFCPTAFDDRGAEWLQSGSDTENPYFGASMFGCGASSETLVPAPGGGDER